MGSRIKKFLVAGTSLGLGSALTAYILRERRGKDAQDSSGTTDSENRQSSQTSHKELKLKNVQIFFRHGARIPRIHLPGVEEVGSLCIWPLIRFDRNRTYTCTHTCMYWSALISWILFDYNFINYILLRVYISLWVSFNYSNQYLDVRMYPYTYITHSHLLWTSLLFLKGEGGIWMVYIQYCKKIFKNIIKLYIK